MTTIAPSIQTLPVFDIRGTEVEQVSKPAIFNAPIRRDIVHFVHTNMSKNRRQPYAVSPEAGMQHSAKSWGTGRAVARIPRISGSGTSRSGQGAFGNMCRKGRRFAPTKIWRKWHRKTSTDQKRYAVVSAVAATAVTSLVTARGHQIATVHNIPLVVDDELQTITKTRNAIEALKAIGAHGDVERCKRSRRIRTGISRLRNRIHSCRRGPLIVYEKDDGIVRAFNNIPGIDLVSVHALNLLQLAPNATLGRFVIWTKSAVNELQS
uniref:Large ribosomal subunit protein uL4 n=1 Tax=Lygus hesperus TaxID=30085 RepID=A0A0A9X9C7_LYGHE